MLYMLLRYDKVFTGHAKRPMHVVTKCCVMHHERTVNTELSNPTIKSKLIDARSRLRNPLSPPVKVRRIAIYEEADNPSWFFLHLYAGNAERTSRQLQILNRRVDYIARSDRWMANSTLRRRALLSPTQFSSRKFYLYLYILLLKIF